MKLVQCIFENAVRAGRLAGDGVELFAAGAPSALDLAMDPAAAAAIAVDRTVAETDVAFLPPVLAPEKIICVGVNYADHAAEAQAEFPPYPSLFVRFPSSQVGHGQPIIAPSISERYDFEGELAVVIGKPAWRVSEEEALSHVAGYSVFAENSVRDFQSHARQITPGKNFLSSGAFGPALVTADEVGDWRTLELVTRLNGEEMQRTLTGAMVYNVERVISYISQFARLMPGDVIATGTPSGVGSLRKPPVWMKPGDVLEIEISRVGRLTNPVAAEP